MDKILAPRIESKAISKYIRISPSKIRRVADQIRGKDYKEALILLEFLPYTCCLPLIKVLRSAAANAQHNHGVYQTSLNIKKVIVDKGPVMRRMRPRARGRAYSILKATSHVTIILTA